MPFLGLAANISSILVIVYLTQNHNILNLHLSPESLYCVRSFWFDGQLIISFVECTACSTITVSDQRVSPPQGIRPTKGMGDPFSTIRKLSETATDQVIKAITLRVIHYAFVWMNFVRISPKL